MPDALTTDHPGWLILRCLPRSERAECERLQSMGIEATHPRI